MPSAAAPPRRPRRLDAARGPKRRQLARPTGRRRRRSAPRHRRGDPTSVTTERPRRRGGQRHHDDVTNGPVPDTAENRAKYGGPMSHAGKRTAAKGN